MPQVVRLLLLFLNKIIVLKLKGMTIPDPIYSSKNGQGEQMMSQLLCVQCPRCVAEVPWLERGGGGSELVPRPFTLDFFD